MRKRGTATRLKEARDGRRMGQRVRGERRKEREIGIGRVGVEEYRRPSRRIREDPNSAKPFEEYWIEFSIFRSWGNDIVSSLTILVKRVFLNKSNNNNRYVSIYKTRLHTFSISYFIGQKLNKAMTINESNVKL